MDGLLEDFDKLEQALREKLREEVREAVATDPHLIETVRNPIVRSAILPTNFETLRRWDEAVERGDQGNLDILAGFANRTTVQKQLDAWVEDEVENRFSALAQQGEALREGVYLPSPAATALLPAD